MDKQIFVSASYYTQKYYANPKFEAVPIEIRNEMRVLCITLAEKIHGIVTVGFYLTGDVYFEVSGEESDYEYDEIGAKLELKQIEKEKKETIKALRLWYLMYQTEYGDIFRKVITLYSSKQKPIHEIVNIICNEYGEQVRNIVIDVLELIQQ